MLGWVTWHGMVIDQSGSSSRSSVPSALSSIEYLWMPTSNCIYDSTVHAPPPVQVQAQPSDQPLTVSSFRSLCLGFDTRQQLIMLLFVSPLWGGRVQLQPTCCMLLPTTMGTHIPSSDNLTKYTVHHHRQTTVKRRWWFIVTGTVCPKEMHSSHRIR